MKGKDKAKRQRPKGKGGPAGGIQGNAVELEEESWDYAFDVGIKSQYLATKHAVPEMIKVGGEHDRLRRVSLRCIFRPTVWCQRHLPAPGRRAGAIVGAARDS